MRQIYPSCEQRSTRSTKGQSTVSNNIPSNSHQTSLTPILHLSSPHFYQMVILMGLGIVVLISFYVFAMIEPQNSSFSILPLSVFEIGIAISKMGSKNSASCDSSSVKLLKIALPYIVETLTCIRNLCIQKNAVFRRYSRELKLFHWQKQRPFPLM